MNKLELKNLLESKDFVEVMLAKSTVELQQLLEKPFSVMQGYLQNNPHHCYDLLEHTLRTVTSLDCTNLSPNEATELKVAALFHDIGKPNVAFEKEGRTVFYNHARESKKIAESILQHIGFEGVELDRICFFIQRHDDFISFKLKTEVEEDSNPFIKPITIKSVYQKMRATQNECKDNKQYVPSFYDFKLLLRLCLADAKAQSPQVIQNGVLVDSFELKAAKLQAITRIIDSIIHSDAECCDMHTHSVFSDGTDTPTQLVQKAEQAGLVTIALTDHNTIKGLSELITASKTSTVDVIPGIEFSTEHDNKELHIVGLFIKNRYYQKVQTFLDNVRMAKAKSNEMVITNLRNAGYNVDYKELQQFAQKDNINRAVIALYLVEKGILTNVKEGFDTILSTTAGYYIPPKRLPTLEAIKFIKSIGAIAVLAHPLIDMRVEELIKFLPEAKKCGLDAIETCYSLYDEETQSIAQELALKNGLLFSGGSDYHGNVKPHISLGIGKGNLNIPLKYYLELVDLLIE